MNIAKNDKDWHRLVCERDNYTCQICGKSFGYGTYFNEKGVNQFVCGHHVLRKKSHPELRLNVDNGICVDDTCHKKLHSGLINEPEILMKRALDAKSLII